jgi:methyl-accepting chemotaxis protein
MATEEIKQRLLKKARVGWRLNFAISAVVVLTLSAFEYLIFLNIDKLSTNPLNFFVIHVIHLLLTIAFLILATYYLISRYVVKPVYKLLIAIDEMKSGKLVTALEIRSNDEFELLAEEFNEMGFKLKEQLQQKVREEKYSSAVAVAQRVARQFQEPFNSLKQNARLLKDMALRDAPALSNLSDVILRDVHEIEKSIRELQEIKPPEESQP